MWIIQRNSSIFDSCGSAAGTVCVYHDEKIAESNLEAMLKRGENVKLFKITLTEVEKKLYFKDVKVGQKFKYKAYPSFAYVKTADDYKICIESENKNILHKLEKYDPVMNNVQVLILE